MAIFSGPPAAAIRNLPICDELKRVLARSADMVGIDEIRIVSGGQPAAGHGTRRTGSTRHDLGRAADIQLIVGGAPKTFTDTSADPVVIDFVSACAANGAAGIGAGVAYMGDRTIHVGFGTSVADHSTLTWGAGGHAISAPRWLQMAASRGWESGTPGASADVASAGRYRVIARNGLKLRLGPGADYESPQTLALGSTVMVIGLDADNAWAKVDLQGDGLIDGHAMAAFLVPAEPDGDNGNV